MKIIDPGHDYELAHLDGTRTSRLTFVKREGPSYPRNVGHHEGTNIQEVLRALIDRVKYLDAQIYDERNNAVISHLRCCLLLLEERAAERHGTELRLATMKSIEELPVCEKCGHITCHGTCHPAT